MNWKLRLKNKATLTALIAVIVTAVYQIAGLLGFTVPIAQEQVLDGVGLVLTLLATLGILTDPTTEGVGDSEQAMSYEEPA